MATRGSIAILNPDKSVDAIYVHYDAYPEYLGNTLVKFHNNQKDASHIIELGDASFIDEKLDPTSSEHSFYKREDNCSLFYGRDRREANTKAKHWNNVDDWLNDAPTTYSAEYMYLWSGSYWGCWDWELDCIELYESLY